MPITILRGTLKAAIWAKIRLIPDTAGYKHIFNMYIKLPALNSAEETNQ